MKTYVILHMQRVKARLSNVNVSRVTPLTHFYKGDSRLTTPFLSPPMGTIKMDKRTNCTPMFQKIYCEAMKRSL